MKYIFITGGVLSSLGKGIAAASIGTILEANGYSVFVKKLDPYINVDPGTMSPYQHGEVYVTDDGAETDLDLGHYSRFTDTALSQANNITTGVVYQNVINKERRGDYLGKTVQVIPHITNEIKRQIDNVGDSDPDIAIIEIGGTVGDIESLPFLEAIRQMKIDKGKDNVIYVHLTYIPYVKTAGELKTKPTQHSVSNLRSIGIQPDIILGRTEKPLTDKVKSKISLFCNVEKEEVVQAIDLGCIYEIPLAFNREGLGKLILDKINLEYKNAELKDWKEIVEIVNMEKDKEVDIAIVGKYVDLRDAYKSIIESFNHAALANRCNVNLVWLESEDLKEENYKDSLKNIDGILVPGGFGKRGIEGKIRAAGYARKNNIPYFGICLGMQIATIEYARNVLRLEKANSTEFDPDTPYPVIDFMPEQKNIDKKGGTMRLGAYKCSLKKGTKTYEAYKEEEISERHRHRYEFNNEYRRLFEEQGRMIAGINEKRDLVEVLELPDHPWFVGVQYHPEFKSKPQKPHPLFRDFVKSSIERKYEK
ncbi:MAG: CTP synthase [Candidatus Mcinerneyibacterium aminivorans]|uniref:CTP synthase n=1 Tax=Candidatus Mcinerneyibacterium aminivorans TaxID=2703815 RepID=A0A5D0MHQ8_9BACT|nr:MAG: CTP synthase [Candidatus Mcinerneyibacterium aminivorans]